MYLHNLINLYPTLSVAHFRATEGLFKEWVFRINKEAEDKGWRSFHINPDGSYLYTDKANEELIPQEQPTLKEESDAIACGQKYLDKLKQATEIVPFLQNALGTKGIQLLPDMVYFDRIERVFRKPITINADNKLEGDYYWRAHYVMKLRPQADADPVPVQGRKVEIDFTWAGNILRVYSNILPTLAPKKVKKVQIPDLEQLLNSTQHPTLNTQPFLSKGIDTQNPTPNTQYYLDCTSYAYTEGYYHPVAMTSEGVVGLSEVGTKKEFRKDESTKRVKDIDGAEHFMTISNIVHPNDESQTPGSATLTIKMNLKVVNASSNLGGVVIQRAEIKPSSISNLFSMGNSVILYLLEIPSLENLGMELDVSEDGNPPNFWCHYRLKVVFDFKILGIRTLQSTENELNTLLDILFWMSESVYTRGIFVLPMENQIMRNYFTDKRSNREAMIKHLVNSILDYYLSVNDINNIELVISDRFIRYYENLSLLKSKNIQLKSHQEGVSTSKDYDTLERIYGLLFNLYHFEFLSYGIFASNEAGAAGNNLSLGKFVLLNPNLFGPNGSLEKVTFGTLNSTEILVHEIGHTCSRLFSHGRKEKDYEYHQEGLQSNRHNKVYPTYKNVMGILNDPANRGFMKIISALLFIFYSNISFSQKMMQYKNIEEKELLVLDLRGEHGSSFMTSQGKYFFSSYNFGFGFVEFSPHKSLEEMLESACYFGDAGQTQFFFSGGACIDYSEHPDIEYTSMFIGGNTPSEIGCTCNAFKYKTNILGRNMLWRFKKPIFHIYKIKIKYAYFKNKLIFDFPNLRYHLFSKHKKRREIAIKAYHIIAIEYMTPICLDEAEKLYYQAHPKQKKQ